MTVFAAQLAALLLGTFLVGCIAGCWARRSFSTRR